ncbi:MAG: ribonuclease D [Desulfobulbaceae bacterium]|nr:MAG: ribonuclease D [Desulfobulbaceae bacterium]
MIDNPAKLSELVDRAIHADSVALDTEFKWERTFYPQLGLIQIALSDEECYLIDPIKIDDLTPLAKLLTSKRVIKIFHDAPQDLAILSRVTKCIPTNVFDTRIAAGFSGLPCTISLANMIRALLDIDLPKDQTRTNWLNRPLDPNQIDYALDDVRYLRAARILLLTRIIVPEIKDWLKDELSQFDDPQFYTGISDFDRFKKIAGAASLTSRSLGVLRELAAWREQEARHLDKPRGHIINDKSLIAIVRDELRSVSDLRQSSHLSNKKVDRYGTGLIKAIETGYQLKKEDLPSIHKSLRLKAPEKKVYDRLTEFIKLKCDLQDVDPQLVGTVTELKLLAKNINNPGSPLPPKLTQGWRRQFLEEFYRQRF